MLGKEADPISSSFLVIEHVINLKFIVHSLAYCAYRLRILHRLVKLARGLRISNGYLRSIASSFFNLLLYTLFNNCFFLFIYIHMTDSK